MASTSALPAASPRTSRSEETTPPFAAADGPSIERQLSPYRPISYLLLDRHNSSLGGAVPTFLQTPFSHRPSTASSALIVAFIAASSIGASSACTMLACRPAIGVGE